MGLSTSKTYYLINRNSGRALNVYAGDISKNSNVVQWTFTEDDKDQQWRIKTVSGGYVLQTAHSSSHVLDAYLPKTSGANADVWQKDGTGAQKLSFIKVDGDYYRVKLSDYNTYLTAIGTSNSNGGFTRTSQGNVYWLPSKGSSNKSQQWKFIDDSDLDEDYNTSSHHSLSNGTTYQLAPASASKRSMNLYNGDTSSNSNIVLWQTDTEDKEQQWVFTKTSRDAYILKYKPNPKFALDAYMPKATGANADVWETGGEYLKDQEFYINKVGSYYEINLKRFPNLFLTAVGDSNGTAGGFGVNSNGNVRWKDYKGDSTQKWRFTEVVEITYPTTSKHNLKIGKVYQFSPLNAPKRNMNLYNGNTSSNSNVVLFEENQNDSQQYWIVDNSTNSTNILRYAPNQTYVLDAYMPKDRGANADVWTYGGNYLKDQELCITEIAKNQYTINLVSRPHLYLTAVNDKDGTLDGYYNVSDGNIYWKPYSGLNNQIWQTNYIGDWKPSVTPSDPTNRPKDGIWGIDVSTHQGTINWAQVKDSGVKFAFIRAGVLTDSGNAYNLTQDNYFHKNMQGAIAEGIPVGVYVFSYLENISNVEGAAQKLIELISEYKNKIQYPVVFDLEDSDDVHYSSMSKEFNTSLTERFCKEIKNAGYVPMWYTYKNFAENNIDAKSLTEKGYDLWLARYDVEQCDYNGDYKIWQYSSKGKVSGINNNVDLNYSYHDYVTNKDVETGGNHKPEDPSDDKMSLIDFSIHLIAKEESENAGKYGAVNKDDLGALSIGKIQWHAERAYELLVNIKNAGGDTSVLPANIIYELNQNNPTLYSNRVLTEEEGTAVSNFISSAIGEKEQDKLLKKDISSYITKFKNKGVEYGDTLAFLCDYYNQSPAAVALLLNKTDDYKLDNVYKLAVEQCKDGTDARRKTQYDYIKSNYDSMCNYGHKSPDDPSSGDDEKPIGENYATYPCKTMNITSGYRDNNHSSYGDYPFDEGCDDAGRSYMYCPCDEMEVVRVYGVGNSGVNTIWLESNSNVIMPCGTDKITMMVMHPNDDDLSSITLGTVFKRGEAMFREGGDGGFANHFHISIGRGTIIGNGWYNNDGEKAWSLQTTGGAIKAEQAFYLDTSFTTILNSKGINFTLLP